MATTKPAEIAPIAAPKEPVRPDPAKSYKVRERILFAGVWHEAGETVPGRDLVALGQNHIYIMPSLDELAAPAAPVPVAVPEKA